MTIDECQGQLSGWSVWAFVSRSSARTYDKLKKMMGRRGIEMDR